MFRAVKRFLTNDSVRYRAMLCAGSSVGILAAYSLSAKLSEIRTNALIVEELDPRFETTDGNSD